MKIHLNSSEQRSQPTLVQRAFDTYLCQNADDTHILDVRVVRLFSILVIEWVEKRVMTIEELHNTAYNPYDADWDQDIPF